MKRHIFYKVTLLLICLGLALSSVALASMETKQGQSDSQKLADEWGIEVVSMRLTADNYMLDFRYKVVDREKARELFKGGIKTMLIDQASGASFAVPNMPKIGPLRSANMPKEGKNYFMLFANPGQYVKAGNLVTVQVGDLEVKNLRVN